MTKHADNSEQVQKYEVGFLLIPTLSEEQAKDAAKTIADKVVAMGGTIEATGEPTNRMLAYEMAKSTVGKKFKYKSAYFGYVVFTLDIVQAPDFKDYMAKIDDVLRFLFIRKDRETVVITPEQVEEVVPAEDTPKASVDVEGEIAETTDAVPTEAA